MLGSDTNPAWFLIGIPLQKLKIGSSKRTRRISNLAPTLLTFACGGGGTANVEKTISEDAPGVINITGGSAYLFQGADEFSLVFWRSDFKNDAGTQILEPEGSYIEENSDKFFSSLESITTSQGSEIITNFDNLTDASSARSPISVSGNLWLIVPNIERGPARLELVQASGDVTFDLLSEDQVLSLSGDSIIEMKGGSIVLDDGRLDLSLATISDLGSVRVGSTVVISHAQLSSISGNIKSASNQSVVEVILNDPQQLEDLISLLDSKIDTAQIRIGLEGKSSELNAAIENFIAEHTISQGESDLQLFVASGQNDAPTDIQLETPTVMEDATAGTVVSSFFVVDPDPEDNHVVNISDSRFTVEDNQIVIADGAQFDFESEPQIEIVLTVKDTGGLTLDRKFSIEVLDVNEPPSEITINPRISYLIEQSYAPVTFFAEISTDDDELGLLEYSLSGPGADFFSITGNWIYLGAGFLPSHEELQNLSVEVSAYDPSIIYEHSVVASFTIPILDANFTLAGDTNQPLVFLDLDTSGHPSAGDQIIFSFNEPLDLTSVELTDFTGAGVNWGSSQITSPNDNSVAITLAGDFGLEGGALISISRAMIKDLSGAVNGKKIDFEFPEIEAPTPIDPNANAFSIDLVYTGSTNFKADFDAGIAFWEDAIVGDLTEVAGIDDLEISVTVKNIDGVGSTLGFAGPTAIRSTNELLPFKGTMTFDQADFNVMNTDERIDVIVHEIGHVLGIGTLWEDFGLISGDRYIGLNAVREYKSLGGITDYIPLETDGGIGTAYSHWDEFLLDDEIMTGYLNYSDNAYSRISIGALEDLGYLVNYDAADPYTVPDFPAIA